MNISISIVGDKSSGKSTIIKNICGTINENIGQIKINKNNQDYHLKFLEIDCKIILFKLKKSKFGRGRNNKIDKISICSNCHGE
jgi:ABC-type cobalamin/Fe3+-siderophores transport system ATPase subunit